MDAAKNPNDLVEAVQTYFQKFGVALPNKEALSSLFNTCYFASMRTEEGRSINCTLSFIDPQSPDPRRPPRIRPQRWSAFKLTKTIPLTQDSLVKLAQAAPPYSATIAIHHNTSNEIFAWGLVDQELHFFNGLNYEPGGRFARPGIFQVEISGVGSLAVYDDTYLVASLRQGNLTSILHDVLRTGPISRKLNPYLKSHRNAVRNLVKEKPEQNTAFYPPEEQLIEENWLSSLSRVLLGIRRQRHGGALLLTDTDSSIDLNPKYSLDYNKISEAVILRTAAEIRERQAWDSLIGLQSSKTIPSSLHYAHSSARHDGNDATQSEIGSITFAASLSRIDGLVWAAEGLHIRGFGVEITTKSEPPSVYIANDSQGKASNLKEVSLSHFGTRHRSMFRYCFAHPKCIGFVISQDGDVRAITRVGQKIIIWENIKIQEIDLEPPKWKYQPRQTRLPARK